MTLAELFALGYRPTHMRTPVQMPLSLAIVACLVAALIGGVVGGVVGYTNQSGPLTQPSTILAHPQLRLTRVGFFGTIRLNVWQRAYMGCYFHRYPGFIGPPPFPAAQPSVADMRRYLALCSWTPRS
jgi:hypothetical protein